MIMEEFAQYNHSTVENNVPFNSYHDFNSYCDWSFTEEQVDFYSFFFVKYLENTLRDLYNSNILNDKFIPW